MLKPFQDFAEKELKKSNVTYKIKRTYTVDKRRMSDEVYVKELPNTLEKIGYYLSVDQDKNGWYRMYQPTIPYKRGQKYGDIPKRFEDLGISY